jgi:hypothetical protein
VRSIRGSICAILDGKRVMQAKNQKIVGNGVRGFDKKFGSAKGNYRRSILGQSEKWSALDASRKSDFISFFLQLLKTILKSLTAELSPKRHFFNNF